MEVLILVFIILIFIETTFLAIRKAKKVFVPARPRRKVYVDTSVLIDGRILSVAQTGFIGDDLIIPRSVIRELQTLADKGDAEKRTRARFGMDIANELERTVAVDVEILQDELDRTPVDERLIELAKENKGLILTNDFNLGKVAATEGIEVLNINDLSLVLRSEHLPGERVKLKITQKGQNRGQGVGHLADGTMVVVENAARKIGSETEIEIIRYLQTSAGKMMFARMIKPQRANR
jgi:uncharacterized protein YacL